jgi:hypothetical protein
MVKMLLVFWIVMLCGLVGRYIPVFGETYCVHLQASVCCSRTLVSVLFLLRNGNTGNTMLSSFWFLNCRLLTTRCPLSSTRTEGTEHKSNDFLFCLQPVEQTAMLLGSLFSSCQVL